MCFKKARTTFSSRNKMLGKITAKAILLSTICLTTLVFARLVQSSPRQAQEARHSGIDDESSGYDFIIKNGRIIDGAGNPWVSGDLAIRGARIVKIGKLEGL